MDNKLKKIKFLVLGLFTSCSFASDGIDYFGLSFENDVFYHEDNGYSNGIIFSWGHYDVAKLDDNSLPSWIAYLSDKTYLPALPDRKYEISYSFGQLVQTADDIKIAELVEDDAPYVGLLAWDMNLSAYNDKQLDDIGFTLGVVGPIAGGEQVQKQIHDWIGANEPMGWDNQISNEVVFRLDATRQWRHFATDVGPTEIDVITGLNAGFGNLLSDANAGVGIRWGQKLKDNFVSSTAFIPHKFDGLKASPNGWFFFANVTGSYVLNDIFINGNTFKDSHSVDLEHWQAGASVGGQINLYNWNFIYTMVYSTKQYETQDKDTRYGTITITYNFK